MKLSLLLLSFALVSCGEYKNQGLAQNKVGDILPVIANSPANGSDRANVSAICNALAQKSNILGTALNSTHTFFASQQDCSGNQMGAGDVETVIQSNGSNFVFKRKSDGLDFIFPNVETPDSGVMAEICNNLSNLTNPVVGNEITYFTTTGISSNDCPTASGEICIAIRKAFAQGNTAQVHTKEWMRVRVAGTQGRVGFFTHRKKVTQSFCAQNEALIFQATLK